MSALDLDFVTKSEDFARGLIDTVKLPSGELALDHAAAVSHIVTTLDDAPELQAACYLLYTVDALNKPLEVLTKNFGASVAALTVETRQLIALQERTAKTLQTKSDVAKQPDTKAQTENVRKMLLAFGRDLRVVLLRLASRLQTLRYYAASKQTAPLELASESLSIFAPLANRLGLGSLKWELEDQSFRYLEPEVYKHTAQLLGAKRIERTTQIDALQATLDKAFKAQGLEATIQARPKHIYSIVKKMRGKNLPFERVFDVRAMRVLVGSVDDCYAALDVIHKLFVPIHEEYDDYIARPKANGYQSLHTVVRGATDGLPIEVQIRTHAMHELAESGVAAHWAYKEAGAKGYAGVNADGVYEQKIAMLRNLLAWEQEISGTQSELSTDILQDRIYVLTPDAQIIDLPHGATPVDFAYAVHTRLGERCRGATVNGHLVPLNTALQSGQTVSITTAKEGGPSRDWLNAELGFIVSARAKAKVRAWFNAQQHEQTVARGREAVEKLLQREGKTALKLVDLATQVGFKSAEDLFEAVGKDEFSPKTIEALWKPQEAPLEVDEHLLQKFEAKQHKHTAPKSGGVLVVGVDSLLTQLAKCCKPAPPDVIGGFVTRGKGVSIHRADCANFVQLVAKDIGRVIDVSWGASKVGALYPVDISVQATDRAGLLRDISEVLAKEKLHVIGAQTQTVRHSGSSGMTPTAWMTFTVEVADTAKLSSVFAAVRGVAGVRSCRRR